MHDFHGDISDAFPSTKLERAFQAIDSDPKYSAYLRFAHGYYGSPRTIHTGVGPAMIVDDGISAGEAFASKFFCATVHQIYRHAREAGRLVDSKLELTAICDDMHITGTVPGIRAAHATMKAGFTSAGYAFNDAKCGLLDPRATQSAQGESQGFTAEAAQFAAELGCKLEKGAVAALGGVIGHDDDRRRQFVTQRFESAANKLEKTLLSQYLPAHLTLSFTRHVLATHFTHLLSVVPPSVSRLGAVLFQHRAQHAVADKLCIETKFRTTEWVTQVSARVGGFGLSLPLNWPLFLASVSRMFQQLDFSSASSFYYTALPPNFPSAPPGFPQTPLYAHPLQVRMLAMPTTIRESVMAMQFAQQARDGARPPNFKPMAPETFLRDALVCFELTTKAIIPPLSKALMSDITQLMDYQYFVSGTSGNQELKQRMEELNDPTARRFFYSSALADHHLVISDVQFALMIRSTLAIPFGDVDLGHKCRCGKIFDTHHPQRPAHSSDAARSRIDTTALLEYLPDTRRKMA